MEKVRPSLISSATNPWTIKFKGKERECSIFFLYEAISKSIIMQLWQHVIFYSNLYTNLYQDINFIFYSFL